MSATHPAKSWDAVLQGATLTVTVTEDQSGRPIRIDARYGRVGNALQGLLDVWCEATSIGLKRGVPLEEYVHTFASRRFAPKGQTGDELVSECTSLVDYILRSVAARYAGAE